MTRTYDLTRSIAIAKRRLAELRDELPANYIAQHEFHIADLERKHALHLAAQENSK